MQPYRAGIVPTGHAYCMQLYTSKLGHVTKIWAVYPVTFALITSMVKMLYWVTLHEQAPHYI